MTEENLFLINTIIVTLTTLLTLFSILFNYEKNKTVKLGKFGWLAIFVALLLAFFSVSLKNIERKQIRTNQVATDSIRTVLINKNDLLVEVISSLKDESKTEFEMISNKVEMNLNQLDSVGKNINREFTEVVNSLKKTEGKIQRKIYESNYRFPDRFESFIDISIGLSKESYNKLKQKLNLSNLVADDSRVAKSIGEHILVGLKADLDFEKGSDYVVSLYGTSNKIEYNLYSEDSLFNLFVTFDLMLDVGPNGQAYASSLFDICDNQCDIQLLIIEGIGFRETSVQNIKLGTIGMYSQRRELLIENYGEGSENQPVFKAQKNNELFYMCKLSDCWQESYGKEFK
jgi:ABC-type multidrug transport system fused ATPase/permease subunit